jgi:hypothetical protein
VGVVDSFQHYISFLWTTVGLLSVPLVESAAFVRRVAFCFAADDTNRFCHHMGCIFKLCIVKFMLLCDSFERSHSLSSVACSLIWRSSVGLLSL